MITILEMEKTSDMYLITEFLEITRNTLRVYKVPLLKSEITWLALLEYEQ